MAVRKPRNPNRRATCRALWIANLPHAKLTRIQVAPHRAVVVIGSRVGLSGGTVAVSNRLVVCSTAGCSYEFGTYPIGLDPIGQRRPCPLCGGFARSVQQPLSAEFSPRARLGYDGHPAGSTSRSRRFAWGTSGWDFSRRLGRLVRKDSELDRRSDRRYEHVVDPVSNDVLHHENLRLNERNHGSGSLD